MLDWARQADTAGFSTLGTLDRLVYDNFDPVPVLAAAAAVTSRIRLTTAIVIAPYRGNGALLGKQLASIDRLSDGRLTVGISASARDDDYTAADMPFHDRGRRLDHMIEEMTDVWAGATRGFAGPIGPRPAQPGGPPLLIGGGSAPAFRRMARRGIGWIAGGGGPENFARGAEQARSAWAAAGREGSPRLASLAYFALGPDAEQAARGYLTDYYRFIGEFAERIADTALTTPDAVERDLKAFAAAGCDELIFFPCSAALDQVERLAEVAGVR